MKVKAKKDLLYKDKLIRKNKIFIIDKIDIEKYKNLIIFIVEKQLENTLNKQIKTSKNK